MLWKKFHFKPTMPKPISFKKPTYCTNAFCKLFLFITFECWLFRVLALLFEKTVLILPQRPSWKRIFSRVLWKKWTRQWYVGKLIAQNTSRGVCSGVFFVACFKKTSVASSFWNCVLLDHYSTLWEWLKDPLWMLKLATLHTGKKKITLSIEMFQLFLFSFHFSTIMALKHLHDKFILHR